MSSVWQVLSEGFPLLTSFHSHSQPQLDSVMHIFTNSQPRLRGIRQDQGVIRKGWRWNLNLGSLASRMNILTRRHYFLPKLAKDDVFLVYVTCSLLYLNSWIMSTSNLIFASFLLPLSWTWSGEYCAAFLLSLFIFVPSQHHLSFWTQCQWAEIWFSC